MLARFALLALLLAGTGGGALLLTGGQKLEAPRETAAPLQQGSQQDPRTVCRPQIDKAWELARSLPPGDLSRKYAENDLNLAAIEENGGETDECQELVERAVGIVRTHPYALPPGETLDISRPAPIATSGRG